MIVRPAERIQAPHESHVTHGSIGRRNKRVAAKGAAVPRPHLLDQTGGDDRINPNGLRADRHTEQRRVKN